MTMQHLLFLALAAALLVLDPMSGAATGSTAAHSSPARDYLSFRSITERNIFDAARSRGSARGSESRQPRRVDSLTLVGTMSYEKGQYAFFDGTRPEFRTVLEPGKTVAGCRVLEVTRSGVRLDNGTNAFALAVGEQLRREPDGGWETASPQSRTPSPESNTSGASEEESDIIKRLMQQREQELK